MKKLKELVKCDYETEILGIQTDSRKVKVGDLFVCIHGLYFDRHHFISQAIEKGAVALIVDQGIKEESRVPIVMVENTNEALLDICKKFYEDPASKLRMIGVTGTDGKTTTATMIQKLFLPFLSTAYMGTNGCHYLNRQIPMDNTTPVPETLYDCLHSIVIEGGEAISLEVSSEALLHNRVGNLSFDAAVFTNITEDHLNIHKTMENYVLSKAKLFGLVKETGFCVLNRDDPYYDTILPYCRGKVVTYGSDPTSDFVISDIKQQEKVTFKIRYSGTEIQIESPYLGKYNVWNLTASFVLGVLFGFDIDKMKETIKRMEPITGRNEQLDFGQDYTIILDYAHTENALKNVLMMARDRKKKRIISVTGSAGGREKEKRSKMGKVVLEQSDFVIFTMDDPREEKVSDIIDEMISSSTNTNYIRIECRKDAIYRALSMAKKDDIVLILGKGRDPYMAIFKERVPYSDYEVISKYFAENNPTL